MSKIIQTSFGFACAAAKQAVESGSPSISVQADPAAMSLYELDPLSDPRWGALIQAHQRGSVFHSLNWLRALHTAYEYEPVVLTTCSPNDNLTNGLVFCRIKSWLTGPRLVSLPFSDHCEPLLDCPEVLDALLMRLKQLVEHEKWRYAEIRPLSQNMRFEVELRRFVTYQFHSLDLSPSTQQLFHSFHKNCVQRKIRRAERERLEYEEGASEDLLQKFYNLLVMTRRRQYLPPQPLGWFRGLVAAFGNDLKIRLASKDGIPVASILTLSHKKTMVYKYGCSNVAFNNLGGTALLFWRTIQDAKERGFEEFEMGRSDVDNQGLVAFKERWGASRRSISYWTYPKKESRELSVWNKKMSRQILSLVPDLALEAVGNLLYRHVG